MHKYFQLTIILLFLSSAGSAQQRGKILFLLTSADELPLAKNDVYKGTGVFLSEFYLPFHWLANNGYQVDFATPEGLAVAVDRESLKPKYWKQHDSLLSQAQAFIASNSLWLQPLSLRQALAKTNDYTALIVPGGQGLMVDVYNHPLTKDLLNRFMSDGKPLGLICHAPALLLSIPKSENPFPGYRLTSVTGLEEWFIESFVMKGKPLNRKIARRLKAIGVQHEHGGPARNFAVRDRRLVTSQNPYSNRAFIKLFGEALADYAQFQHSN